MARRPMRCRDASCADPAIGRAHRNYSLSASNISSGMAMKKGMARKSLLAGVGVVGLMGAATGQPTEWKDWGGDAARTHYSVLNQITTANVAGLKPAWIWDSGKLGRSWEIT